MFSQRKECPRCQNAECFVEKLCPIRNIHCHVLGVATVKHRIAVRQMLSVTQYDLYLPLHIQQIGKLVGRNNERGCDIDPTNSAPEALRKITRRSADPATDVHDVVACLNRQRVSELDGCRKSPCMEMIERCQLFDRYGVRGNRRCLHRLEYPGIDIAASPMLRNRLRFRHRSLPDLCSAIPYSRSILRRSGEPGHTFLKVIGSEPEVAGFHFAEVERG